MWPSSSTCRVVSRIAAASSVSTWATRGCTGAPLPDQRHAAGEQVVDDGVVAVAAQREDRRVDGLGRQLGDGPLGVLDGLRHEQHRAARGVELLGEAVEHGERERVVEGVAQRPLDDHRHGADPALPQRRRERVGAGVGQVARGGAHPLCRGRRHRALAAEDQGCRRRRDPGPARDVAQRGAARRGRLTGGGHGRHNIESIRSNRFDTVPPVPRHPPRNPRCPPPPP